MIKTTNDFNSQIITGYISTREDYIVSAIKDKWDYNNLWEWQIKWNTEKDSIKYEELNEYKEMLDEVMKEIEKRG